MMDARSRWYRGDFHAHTNCSDGFYSPVQLVELAKAEGLDFLAITDHNTIEAFSKIEGNPGLMILRGIEITLRDGDLNVFGVDQRLDWMDQICVTTKRISHLEGKYRTTTELMRQISAQELLNSMNHPLLKPWEWRDRVTELRYLSCMEIWNDPSWLDNTRDNPRAVALWTDLLNAGYRIAGIGGSDYHRPVPRPGEVKPAERLGVPSTYVLARELSSPAILNALRQRRAYVSMGPRVSFYAQARDTRYEIGDDIGELTGAVEFSASISDAPDSARAQIVKNGEIFFEAGLNGNPARLQYRAQVDTANASWLRLDVQDRDGVMLAITNPIFVGAARQPTLRRFGDFVPA